MHDYKQLRVELIGKGFSEAVAFKIVDFIELEDLTIERLHAAECLDKERHSAAFLAVWIFFFELEKKYEFEWHAAADLISKQTRIEGQQRARLLNTNQRDKSVFLVSILKYFCSLDDPHVLLVLAALESASKSDVGVMNMSFG